MWLRNKKTGRVCDARVRERKNRDGTYSTIVCTIEKHKPRAILAEYYSLAKLYEEWEDYKLAEPLIKDEKIRKFIRDYFGIWGLKIDKGTKIKIKHFDFRTRIYCDTFEIVLPKIDELDICRSYTIEELCGEEKE